MGKPTSQELEHRLLIQRKKENRFGLIALAVAVGPLLAGLPFEDSINSLGPILRRITILLLFAPGLSSFMLYIRFIISSRKTEYLTCPGCGRSLMTADGKLSVRMGVCGNCGELLTQEESSE